MKNCYVLLGIVFGFCLVNQVFSAPADSNLDAALPWLKDILDDDDILTLPSGQHKLGSDQNISVKPTCTNTPFLIVQGECTLLKDCPRVYPELRSVDDYVKSFCSLDNGFAGVCCPIVVDIYTGKPPIWT